MNQRYTSASSQALAPLTRAASLENITEMIIYASTLTQNFMINSGINNLGSKYTNMIIYMNGSISGKSSSGAYIAGSFSNIYVRPGTTTNAMIEHALGNRSYKVVYENGITSVGTHPYRNDAGWVGYGVTYYVPTTCTSINLFGGESSTNYYWNPARTVYIASKTSSTLSNPGSYSFATSRIYTQPSLLKSFMISSSWAASKLFGYIDNLKTMRGYNEGIKFELINNIVTSESQLPTILDPQEGDTAVTSDTLHFYVYHLGVWADSFEGYTPTWYKASDGAVTTTITTAMNYYVRIIAQ